MNKYFGDGITRDWIDDDFRTIVLELELLKQKIFEKEMQLEGYKQELARIRERAFPARVAMVKALKLEERATQAVY